MPVSRPDALVTYGNNSAVWQRATVKELVSGLLSTNLGIGAVADALCGPITGAKLMSTVVVPAGGVFVFWLPVKLRVTPKSKLSFTSGLAVITSQTAVADPPLIGSA